MVETGNNEVMPFSLDELNGLYGEETVLELLQMSVDEAVGLLDQVRSGLDAKDSRVVMAAAHQLKGLASTMTIHSLSQISLELETAARQEEWPRMPEIAARLESNFAVVRRCIEQVLQNATKAK